MSELNKLSVIGVVVAIYTVVMKSLIIISHGFDYKDSLKLSNYKGLDFGLYVYLGFGLVTLALSVVLIFSILKRCHVFLALWLAVTGFECLFMIGYICYATNNSYNLQYLVIYPLMTLVSQITFMCPIGILYKEMRSSNALLKQVDVYAYSF